MLPQFVWPTSGTGTELAGLLQHASMAAPNVNNGKPAELVENYLRWGGEQVRMLRGRLTSLDLDRLVTTPRYWAIYASPASSPSAASAVSDELTARSRQLEELAKSLSHAAAQWRSDDSRYASLAVVDTSFWMETADSFRSVEWHSLLPPEPEGQHLQENELRPSSRCWS